MCKTEIGGFLFIACNIHFLKSGLRGCQRPLTRTWCDQTLAILQSAQSRRSRSGPSPRFLLVCELNSHKEQEIRTTVIHPKIGVFFRVNEIVNVIQISALHAALLSPRSNCKCCLCWSPNPSLCSRFLQVARNEQQRSVVFLSVLRRR